MDYEIIKSRHSVRAYLDRPIPAGKVESIEAMIRECNEAAGLDIQLVTDEPKAFGTSLMARYGKFENVRNYICMIGPKGGDTEEKLGYYGERLVLKTQEMGLNTCWVGMSFKKGKVPARIAEGMKLYAVIAIGYGKTQGVSHKIKSPDRICPEIASTPGWFKRGVDCALLAPTAVNQQKFHFKWLGGKRAVASTSWGFYAKMDLGIARLHFELGVRPEKVEWERGDL